MILNEEIKNDNIALSIRNYLIKYPQEDTSNIAKWVIALQTSPTNFDINHNPILENGTTKENFIDKIKSSKYYTNNNNKSEAILDFIKTELFGDGYKKYGKQKSVITESYYFPY